MNISLVKNVQFKGTFVIDNLDKMRKHYPFKSCVIRSINVAKRDGLQCHCCGSAAVFKLDKMYGMIMYAANGRRMTMDHDLLNSLEGSNMLHNQHLLCEKCNNMRGNLFAEYQEFKYWYDSCLLNNLNPNKEINKVKRNFTYLDLNKNGFKKSELQKIPVVVFSKMPENISTELLQHYHKHNQFLPSRMPVKFKRLINISGTAWDHFINDMVVTLVYNRLGKEVTASNKGHAIINNKTKHDIKSLCNKLNHVVSVEYLKHREELRKLTPKVPNESIESVVNIVAESPKPSLWTRFLSIFTKKIAATA